LRVADCFDGLLRSSPYFVEYERNPETWTMEFGAIDGEPAGAPDVASYGDGHVWPPAIH
jgi:hypothetical protein